MKMNISLLTRSMFTKITVKIIQKNITKIKKEQLWERTVLKQGAAGLWMQVSARAIRQQLLSYVVHSVIFA